MTSPLHSGGSGAEPPGPSSNEIRRQFLDFFVERDHLHVPSAPLPAVGDPTLMFVNSGMVQFKDVFLGLREPPALRVCNSQKCLRVSGKHNDLEEVGRSPTHHTFFEMLGYWSFGDYFKREAIAGYWELLTDVWKLPKDLLYATVFAGDEGDGVPRDDEAGELWTSVTDIDPSHLRFLGKDDNFWEMGPAGPCGPDSEVFIDLTPDRSGATKVGGDDPRVTELGNNVFIQYNRGPDGRLTPLPRRHVDFGGGFERIVAILQGKDSNYDTDLFTPIFATLRDIAGGPGYRGTWDDPADTAYRVIGDHLRCLTFTISDGVPPKNEGPGYVLRRILRRAVRHGRQSLGLDEPFLWKLVPTLVELMGEAYPELRREPDMVAAVIREEEQSFQRTIGRGIELFADAERRAGASRTISGEDAFKLHDTYGFPLDLTDVMASERGLTVDADGFDRLMDAQRELSRAAADGGHAAAGAVLLDLPPTEFLGYAALEADAEVLAIVRGVEPVPAASAGDEVHLVLGRTPFYAEGGGQIGDRGTIEGPSGRADVLDCTVSSGLHLHAVRVATGELRVGDTVHAVVSRDHRAGVEPAHTATHMLHHTLRTKLGDHVRQMGSHVEPGRLHFDFSHFSAVPRDHLDELEETVNAGIAENDPVEWFETSYKEATESLGAIAFFEDKYGDSVRVVQIGQYSRELCGGTHVGHTGRVGFVKILREQSIGASVRRVEALTGVQGLRWVQERLRGLERAAELARVTPDAIVEGIERMQKAQKDLQRTLDAERQRQAGSAVEDLLGAAREANGGRVVVARRADDVDTLRKLATQLRDKLGRGFVILGRSGDKGVNIVAAATRGLDARVVLEPAAPHIGGRSSGKPEFAQAGGGKPDGLDAALAAAGREAESALGR